jgi:hypothetical protein
MELVDIGTFVAIRTLFSIKSFVDIGTFVAIGTQLPLKLSCN